MPKDFQFSEFEISAFAALNNARLELEAIRAHLPEMPSDVALMQAINGRLSGVTSLCLEISNELVIRAKQIQQTQAETQKGNR